VSKYQSPATGVGSVGLTCLVLILWVDPPTCPEKFVNPIFVSILIVNAYFKSFNSNLAVSGVIFFNLLLLRIFSACVK
jgi:hypothetical protein